LSLIWERTKREAGIETPTRSQKEIEICSKGIKKGTA
jgi:hypothetical protein